MDPRIITQIMLARFPEFMQFCVNEAMLGAHPPMPVPPRLAVPPEHLAYQKALLEASNQFAAELAAADPPSNGGPVQFTFAEGSAITVDGRDFLRRHFARNYHLHFQHRTHSHYAATGRPVSQAIVAPDGGGIELRFTQAAPQSSGPPDGTF